MAKLLADHSRASTASNASGGTGGGTGGGKGPSRLPPGFPPSLPADFTPSPHAVAAVAAAAAAQQARLAEAAVRRVGRADLAAGGGDRGGKPYAASQHGQRSHSYQHGSSVNSSSSSPHRSESGVHGGYGYGSTGFATGGVGGSPGSGHGHGASDLVVTGTGVVAGPGAHKREPAQERARSRPPTVKSNPPSRNLFVANFSDEVVRV